MSAHFLAQLAHRAVAAPAVRPRVGSRFESGAAAESRVERASNATRDAGDFEPERAAPLRAVSEPLARAPHAVARETAATSHRILTRTEHTEHVERTIYRDAPLPEPQRPALPTANRAGELAAPTPPAPASAPPAAPLLASPPAPALSPAMAPVVAHEAAATMPVTPVLARMSTPAAPLLVSPPLPAPVVHAHSPAPPTRREPAIATPAPIEIVIGRIEIRGDSAPEAAARAPTPVRRAGPTLDDYLRGRG